MFGGILIVGAANLAALLVELGYSFLGPRQGEVLAVGLLPVPGRAMRITALFAGSSHSSIPLKS